MRAAFFDVDGTLTETRVWNGMMDYFREHRKKVVLDRFFHLFHYFIYLVHLIGLISQVRFREIWTKNISWYLKGYSVEEVEDIWDWVVSHRINTQWRDDILEKLSTHISSGDVVFLVSGGPEGLLKRIAEEIGAHYVVGTRHVVENGFYTGKSPQNACQGELKASLVKVAISELNLEIDLQASFAYADALGDLHLLEMVGNPVAVYPDEYLRPVALDRNWKIIE